MSTISRADHRLLTAIDHLRGRNEIE